MKDTKTVIGIVAIISILFIIACIVVVWSASKEVPENNKDLLIKTILYKLLINISALIGIGILLRAYYKGKSIKLFESILVLIISGLGLYLLDVFFYLLSLLGCCKVIAVVLIAICLVVWWAGRLSKRCV